MVTETKEDETVNKDQVSVIANESEEMIVLLISEWNIERDSNITTQVTDENKAMVWLVYNERNHRSPKARREKNLASTSVFIWSRRISPVIAVKSPAMNFPSMGFNVQKYIVLSFLF